MGVCVAKENHQQCTFCIQGWLCMMWASIHRAKPWAGWFNSSVTWSCIPIMLRRTRISKENTGDGSYPWAFTYSYLFDSNCAWINAILFSFGIRQSTGNFGLTFIFLRRLKSSGISSKSSVKSYWKFSIGLASIPKSIQRRGKEKERGVSEGIRLPRRATCPTNHSGTSYSVLVSQTFRKTIWPDPLPGYTSGRPV